VLLRDGMLIAYIGRAERDLLTFLPTAEPERGQTAVALAAALASRVEEGRRSAFLVSRIDGQDPDDSQLAPYLRAAGFTPGARGYLKRVEAVG
jgi:ATP-dependent Lhr-like helicase